MEKFHDKTGLPDFHQNYKIMLVDDEAIYLVEFEDILREHGYRVYAALDGESCLELTEIYRPDIILLDIAMPKMSGFEVLRKLKENPTYKRIPIILVTGKSTAPQIPSDCKALIADFFQKPFAVDTLLDRIEKILLQSPN